MKKLSSLLVIVILEFSIIFTLPRVSNTYVPPLMHSTSSSSTSYEFQNTFIEHPISARTIKPMRLGVSLTLRFPDPIFIQSSINPHFVIPVIPGASYLITPGKPLIPINVTVIKLPYNSHVLNVSIKIYEKLISVPSWILPAPYPMIINEGSSTLKVDISFYTRDIWYNPINMLPRYRIVRGLDPNTLTRKTFLFIIIPLMSYNPARNLARFVSRVEINIVYFHQQVVKTLNTNHKLDLLIITSRTLEPAAIKLAKIKNSTGILSTVKTVEDISTEYAGRDLPEKIRNCIKYFVNNYNITYVLLFGDADQVPARLVYIPDGAYDNNPEIDGAFVETDLYYADLDYTWNENNDSKWGELPYDKVDGIPDVIVGRIPASTLDEADSVVNKLINYNPKGAWTHKVTLVGSDLSFSYYPEGEYVMDYLARNVLLNFSVIKLYETYGNATRLNVYHEFMSGRWFIDFGSHGLPTEIAVSYTESFTKCDVLSLQNKILPIVAGMSCLINRFVDFDSIGEALIIAPNGGAIAVFGSTRIAWGYIGELVTTGLAGEMNILFTKALVSSKTIGEAWAKAITNYAIEHPIYYRLDTYYLDWKTLAEFVLFGDPTTIIKPTPESVKEIHEPINVGLGNSTYLENNSYNVLANITVDGGTLVIRNATVHLHYSYIIVNSGQIMIENSTIYGTIIVNSASLVKIKNSIVDSIKCSDAYVLLDNSVANVSVARHANIVVNDSVIKLDLTIINTSITWTLSEGFINNRLISYNTWSLTITNSIITWIKLRLVNCSINLNAQKISEVLGISSKLRITSSTINSLKINNSNATVTDSKLGLSFVVINKTIFVSDLSPKYVDYQEFNISGLVTIENSSILDLHFYLLDSEIFLENSTLSSIIGSNTVVHFANSSIYYIYAKEVQVINGTSLEICGEIINISNSYINFVRGKTAIIRNSIIEQVIAANGNLEIFDSRIESIILYNETTLIQGSRIPTLLLYETSSVIVNASRFAFIDVHDYSRMTLENSDILYELRIFSASNVTVLNSFGWIALIIEEEISFSELYSGYIISKTISSFNLTVLSSLIMWDIIVRFHGNLTLISSQVDWLFAFHDSSIHVKNSNIGLARITHRAHAFFSSSRIDQLSVSGTAEVTVLNSFIDIAIVLGNSHVSLSTSYVNMLVPFGNIYLEATRSIIGIEVLIENSTIDVELNDAYYYILHIEDLLPVSFSSNVRETYIQWYLVFENSNISVHHSHITLLACFGPCNITVEYSTFQHLYLINAKASIVTSKVSYLGFVAASNVFIQDSTVLFLYITENSSISMINSISRIILELHSGHYNFMLNSGVFSYLDSTTLGIPKTVLNLVLRNCRILAWDLILTGDSTAHIYNSTLVSLLLLGNSSAEVENSKIAYLIVGDSAEANIEDSKLGIVPFITFSNNVTLSNLLLGKYDSLVIGKTNGTSFTIVLRNSQILEWTLYMMYSTAIISNCIFYNVTLGASSVIIQNSNIKGYAIMQLSSVIAIDSSIKSAILTASDLEAQRVKIRRLSIHQLSVAYIEDSNVGLELDLTNVQGIFSMNTTKTNLVLSSANMTGITWLLVITNSSISSVSVSVSGPANVTLIHSQFESVSVSGPAFVRIYSCKVGKLSVKALSDVTVSDSQTSVELFLYGKGTLSELTTGTLKGKLSNFWNLSLDNTLVNHWNATITANSNFTLVNSDFRFVTVKGISYVYFINSSSIYAILRDGSKSIVQGSKLLITYISDACEVTAIDSSLGLVFVFVGEKGNISFITGHVSKLESTDYFNLQPWFVEMINSEIMHWNVYGISSTITLKNQHLLGVIAYVFSNITLIDTKIENPLYAEYGSQISVLWTLTVRVYLDFSLASNSRVEIFREHEKIAEINCSNGIGKIILPQAIIMDSMRLDAGHYSLVAHANGYQASKEIYLWRTMTVDIYVFSYPVIITIICGIIGIIAFVVYIIKRRSKSKQTVITI